MRRSILSCFFFRSKCNKKKSLADEYLYRTFLHLKKSRNERNKTTENAIEEKLPKKGITIDLFGINNDDDTAIVQVFLLL